MRRKNKTKNLEKRKETPRISSQKILFVGKKKKRTKIWYVVQELLEQHWGIVAVRSSLDLDAAWLRQLDRENFVDVVTFETLE